MFFFLFEDSQLEQADILTLAEQYTLLLKRKHRKIFHLLSWSVLTTITDGGPSPFTVKATTEILYLTNSFSPVRSA